MNGEDPRFKSPWLFGYGSVIYRPSFAYVERVVADLPGYSRRFSQLSDDHRGTVERPGRVVTLRETEGASVRGIAYRFDSAQAETIFAELDVREKAGYVAQRVTLTLAHGERVDATAYIAPPGNAWDAGVDGDESIETIGDHILHCVGPSGTNLEYLLKLADALRTLNDPDAHVQALERYVLARRSAREG